MLRKILLIIFSTFIIFSSVKADRLDKMFFIGKMESHNKDFTLFFKTREKAVLARGENYNYVTDYPQDLYIYDNKLKKASPLISYDWFPTHVKFFLNEYNFPVFPEDFAYYLLKDNNTLIMISAVKNFNKNFKFDIANEPKYSYFTKYDNHMMEYDENLLIILKKFLHSLN